ncbi:YlxM family DNA-binding protein [Lachnospiraceae bacterium NSJ-143]|nr:YlxM family DNA-binding protein [Lachnospiraceae bacterium NSJ-143]
MDDILKATLLYDFYGELLTERQKTVFEYYHLNDCSLTEIGEELGISRQAVRDLLKRTETLLAGYEEKLRLVERFGIQKESVRRIKNLAQEIEQTGGISTVAIEKIDKIKEIADEILD